MAKSYIPLGSPCTTYGALLDRNVMASGKYHEATSALVSLAGKDTAADFANAKRDCEACLDECKRTASAMRAHKAAHGC
jgi:hypothetical protein